MTRYLFAIPSRGTTSPDVQRWQNEAASFTKEFKEKLTSRITKPKENPMSHLVVVETKVHDAAALAAACRRLGLAEPVRGDVQFYSGEATGLSVRLPGWQYPIVIDTAAGSIKYDNYEGRWGDPAELGRLLQMYAVEKAKLEARRKGYAVSESQLQDGSIKLQILEGGAG
jgi:hypothetical protein